jgi:hypothetical protein
MSMGCPSARKPSLAIRMIDEYTSSAMSAA